MKLSLVLTRNNTNNKDFAFSGIFFLFYPLVLKTANKIIAHLRKHITEYNRELDGIGKMFNSQIVRLSSDPLISIRKCENEDLEYIFDLEFKEMNEILFEAWQGSFSWKNWRNDLAEAVNSDFHRVFIIQVQEMPVGYLWLNEEINSLWITAIVIDSSWQRRRIGHYVLEYLIKSCETDGKEFIELGVQNNNQKALQFYKSIGFQQFDHLRQANTDLLRLEIRKESDLNS